MAAIDTCIFLGIYPYNIEKASEAMERACERFDVDSDHVWDDIRERFAAEYGHNFGNRVIELIFDCTLHAIEHEAVVDGERLDYGVNGLDSYILIDGEEV